MRGRNAEIRTIQLTLGSVKEKQELVEYADKLGYPSVSSFARVTVLARMRGESFQKVQENIKKPKEEKQLEKSAKEKYEMEKALLESKIRELERTLKEEQEAHRKSVKYLKSELGRIEPDFLWNQAPEIYKYIKQKRDWVTIPELLKAFGEGKKMTKETREEFVLTLRNMLDFCVAHDELICLGEKWRVKDAE